MLSGLVAWWGKNPVAGNLVMLACVIAGTLSFLKMEKEFWPAGRGDAVTITANWPGASPEDMESQVTVRLEEAVADLNGVDYVRSRSGEGFAWVRLFVDPGFNVDTLTQQAKSKIDGISGLPSGIEPPQVAREVNRNWSIILSLSGEASERVLRDTAEKLRDDIALLPGGVNTSISGTRQPEVSIELSEEALRRYNLTFAEVSNAVRRASINLSAGSVRTADGDYQLRARNLADTRTDFSAIVVRQSADGGVVRLGDVASIQDGFQDVNLYSTSNGERSVLITILTADKFNIWDTSKSLDKFLKEARQELPAGLKLTKIYDEAEDFSSLTGILFSNALQGFVLIFLLLLLTIHPKVAVWATLGVMTAFAGSFFILPYVDVSLNFMSVFGFLRVLGIMVDDAIIVGEAVYERVEQGHHGADAAILATQLVLKPLVASVFVTMIAFSPWMLISGDARQFTRAISIVVMSTLVFSLIESLIILPAHLAHVNLPSGGTSLLARLMTAQHACANFVVWVAKNLHGPVLRTAVRWRYLTLACFTAVLLFSFAVVGTGRVKQTFFPEVEGDFLIASIEMPAVTPYGRMEQVAQQLDKARIAIEAETKAQAVKDPNTGEASHGVVRSWSQSINETTIQAFIGLTPPETRPDLRSKAVSERLKALLGEVPGAERINFEFNGGGNGASIQLALMGRNQEELRASVEELKAQLLTYAQVSSVRDSEEAAVEELRFTMLPGAQQMGISLSEVSNQVRQAYFGEEVQRLPREGEDVRVYVRYPRDARRSLDSLEAFRVRTADGREVPLAAVAQVDFAPGVTGLDRRQRLRSILVEAEAPKEARTTILKELNQSGFFNRLEQKYPSITRRAIGEAEAQAEFFGELLGFGAMALFAMYALLAIVFRSYFQPLLVMSAIPFAFMGAAFGHWAFGSSFALFSYLGVIAAAGVVVNDNVVLVDRANQIRETGVSAFEGITEAGVSRFRQIFLTSITEFVGLAPMLFEDAAIAQFLKPMALSMAFGVLLCMPVTLILTPTFYMVAKDIKDLLGALPRGWMRVWRGREASATPAE